MSLTAVCQELFFELVEQDVTLVPTDRLRARRRSGVRGGVDTASWLTRGEGVTVGERKQHSVFCIKYEGIGAQTYKRTYF